MKNTNASTSCPHNIEESNFFSAQETKGTIHACTKLTDVLFILWTKS